MNFKELDKLHSDYLNACESEFEMGKVFELAKKGLHIEQIRAEIEALPRELPTDARNMIRRTSVLDIIDRHMKGADK